MTRKSVKNLSISALIAVGALSPLGFSDSVFAETITADGEKVWSISEARSLFHEYEFKRNEACANDYSCQLGYLANLSQQDSKYNVVSAYLGRTFWISAVNPQENSIKGYYQNFSFSTWRMRVMEMVRRNNPDVELSAESFYSSPIAELYAYWLPEDAITKWFVVELRNNQTVDGLHPIAKARFDVGGYEWLPAETEIEFQSPSSELLDNTSASIYYYINTNTSGSFSNVSDYSTCVNSANYTSGMECRLMFKEDGSFTYLPFSTQVEVDDTTASDDTNTSEDDAANTDISDTATSNTDTSNADVSGATTSDPITSNATTSDGAATDISNDVDFSGTGSSSLVATSGELGVSNTSSTSGASSVETNANDSTTPDTGEATAPQKNSTEFPWWLSVVFLLGVGTIAWLFWPRNQKKPKNN